MQNINLDIVNLIEINPLVRLSKNYENKFIQKIKDSFTESQQRLFISSFYTYLNYNSKTDFIIELESIWKWLGFSRVDPAKRVLEKHFKENIDYKIITIKDNDTINLGEETIFHQLVENKNTETRGRKKEKILMTVNTFKKLCLKSDTKKADEIHDYFIKLEEILEEIINEESNEIKLQLLEKEKLIQQKDYLLIQNKQDLLLNNFDKDSIVYIIKINEDLFKFGNTDNIKRRFSEHKREIENNIQLIFCINSKNNTLLEQRLKEYLKNTDYRKELIINNKLQTELIKINDISIIENELITFNKHIEENKEHLEIKKLELELEILKLKIQLENTNQKEKNKNKSSYLYLPTSNISTNNTSTNNNDTSINTNDIPTSSNEASSNQNFIKDTLKNKLIDNIENENKTINENKDNLLNFIEKKVDEHIDSEIETKIKNLKLKGISIKKNKKGKIKYQATFKHNNKSIFCGYFDTRIEAGLAYNKKAIEICGEDAKINIIPEEILNYINIKSPRPIIPDSFKSKYLGVKIRNNRYRSVINFQGKEIYLGTYDTEIEAAMAYNKKLIELYGEHYRKNQINIFSDEILKQYSNFQINVNNKPKENKIKKYIGITYQNNKFNSRFNFNKKSYYVGRFNSELEAVKAYNKKALEICGNNAKINIIDPEPS